MKKILFIDHQSELSGGEIMLAGIIDNLDKERFSAVVLLGANGPFADKLRKSGTEVVIEEMPLVFKGLKRSPKTKFQIPRYVKAVLSINSLSKSVEKIIKQSKPDIVYINTIKSLLCAGKPAKKLNCKTIWHLHDCLTADFYRSWIIKNLIRFFKYADKVICVSSVVKDAFVRAGGDKNKAYIVYNGIDIKKFHVSPGTDSIKKELNPKNKKTVSIIGRLEDWKGHAVFLEAAETICKKRNDITFLIVGGALFGQKIYEKELKNKVNDLHLERNVLFLGFRSDIEKIINISDVIVHPSVKPEPFGRDIIEAMACGKTVIATDMGGPVEIIENGEDGFLIEPNNARILAEKILDVVDDEEGQRQIAINARKKAEERFGIRKIVRQIEVLLEEN